jgi:hypothetical protein
MFLPIIFPGTHVPGYKLPSLRDSDTIFIPYPGTCVPGWTLTSLRD